jgi:Flp pilus assembly pilin Flp
VTADERGASLVEYVFLLMLITLVALAAVEFLGTEVSDDLDSFNTELGNARNGADPAG